VRASCEMTLLFVNHLRLGSTLAFGLQVKINVSKTHWKPSWSWKGKVGGIRRPAADMDIQFSGLESSSLCDFSLGISFYHSQHFPSSQGRHALTRLSLLEAVEQLDLFGVAVKVLALGLDICHAVAEFALALLAGALFLSGAHIGIGCPRDKDSVSERRAWWEVVSVGFWLSGRGRSSQAQ
jgi:hypothetical protein